MINLGILFIMCGMLLLAYTMVSMGSCLPNNSRLTGISAIILLILGILLNNADAFNGSGIL